MAISVRENRENQLESGQLKDAFWLVSEALYEVSKVLNLPAEMLAETLGLDGVRSKYSEIRLTKEEQRLDVSSRAPLNGARDDRETRDRKDRDFERLTIIALLGSERLREQLRDTYKAFDDTRDKGRELLDQIAALRAQIQQERDYLLAQHTARHPVTNEPLIRYRDGRIKDAKGNAAEPEDVKHIPPESMVPGERWDALERSETELDQLEVRARNGMQSLDNAETKMESGIKADPDKAKQHMTDGKKTQESVDSEFEDISGRLEELTSESELGVGPVTEIEAVTMDVGLGPKLTLR